MCPQISIFHLALNHNSTQTLPTPSINHDCDLNHRDQLSHCLHERNVLMALQILLIPIAARTEVADSTVVRTVLAIPNALFPNRLLHDLNFHRCQITDQKLQHQDLHLHRDHKHLLLKRIAQLLTSLRETIFRLLLFRWIKLK